MDKIISIKDLLLEIINHCGDVNDWFNFMFSSKNIYLHVYPEFIFKQFNIMIFYDQTLPPCIRNNSNIKCYYYPGKGRKSPAYITTSEKLIFKYCQLENIGLYKTYGIFFQGLYLNKNNCLHINYEKIYELIDNNIENNIHDKYIFNNYKSIANKTHIDNISAWDSYKITKKFIKTIDNTYYQQNMVNIKRYYNKRIIKSIRGETLSFWDKLPLLLPSKDFNICEYCDNKYITDLAQLHKNWKLNSGSTDEWTRDDPDIYISETDYKTNPFYQPIKHQKIENI